MISLFSDKSITKSRSADSRRYIYCLKNTELDKAQRRENVALLLLPHPYPGLTSAFACNLSGWWLPRSRACLPLPLTRSLAELGTPHWLNIPQLVRDRICGLTLQHPCPLVDNSGARSPLSLKGSWWDWVPQGNPLLHASLICVSPCPASLPQSLSVLPAITWQIKDFCSNPWLRICFGGTPMREYVAWWDQLVTMAWPRFTTWGLLLSIKITFRQKP